MALKENIMEQIHFASEKLKNGRREKKIIILLEQTGERKNKRSQ